MEELCSTSAAHRSYSETEFHDWNRGIDFMTGTQRANTARIIASAIDNHFGAPR